MVSKRYRDSDIWPDNWKEWSISLILVSSVLWLGAAVMETGAPTSFTDERGVRVTVAGDSTGAVSLQPYDGPNGDPGGVGRGDEPSYARLRSGHLELNTVGTFATVFGRTQDIDSNTDVENVFTITNRGRREVAIRIVKRDDLTTGENGEYANAEANAVLFYHTRDDGLSATPETPLIEERPAGSTFTYESNEYSLTADDIELDPGESVTVSMRIDTSADTVAKDNNRGDDLIDSVTVIADASATADPNTEVGDNDGRDPTGD